MHTSVAHNRGRVLNKIDDEELRSILASELSSRTVGSAHWFRDADMWYRLNYGYNNPLNIGMIHSELHLLEANRAALARLLRGRSMHFFGVGVGDTEMALV